VVQIVRVPTNVSRGSNAGGGGGGGDLLMVKQSIALS
jgi:hypothetical protein